MLRIPEYLIVKNFDKFSRFDRIQEDQERNCYINIARFIREWMRTCAKEDNFVR